MNIALALKWDDNLKDSFFFCVCLFMGGSQPTCHFVSRRHFFS